MTKHAIALIITLAFLLPSGTASAGPPGSYTTVPVFNQNPLEAKLGTFEDRVEPPESGPSALAMLLWNDGVGNRLDAVRIPPPYDGSGLTSTSLEGPSNLFSLGDICTVGNNVVVPYIKNFNVEIARFNGNSWTTSSLPGTTINNFDSADCAVTNNGIFVSAHDLTDNENEVFRSTNGGSDYTFYGRYGGVAGPFGGGVREALTSDQTRYMGSLHQTLTGQIRVAEIDTNQPTLTPSFTNIAAFAPPSGFTFVKESAARGSGNGQLFFSYNADGTARVVDFTPGSPSTFVQRTLGPVSNSNPFGFQGGTLVSIEDPDGNSVHNNVLWGDYFFYDPTSIAPPSTDTSYPAAGRGGPVAGCRVDSSSDFLRAFFLVPRGAPFIGTDLLQKSLEPFSLFEDGFESGDVSAWSQCN